MDERRTYVFMGDNARRFMGLPIANPTPTPSSRGPWRTLDRTPSNPTLDERLPRGRHFRQMVTGGEEATSR